MEYTENLDTEVQNPDTNLQSIVESTNMATELDDDKLEEIGEECFQGYEVDGQSSQHWRDLVEEWLAIATQAMEEKNYPWPNASHVKFPLVSIAAMQFSARAYPT